MHTPYPATLCNQPLLTQPLNHASTQRTASKPPYGALLTNSVRRTSCSPFAGGFQFLSGNLELITGVTYGAPKGVEFDVQLDNGSSFDVSPVCKGVKLSAAVPAYTWKILDCKGSCKSCFAKLDCRKGYKLRMRARAGGVGVAGPFYVYPFGVDCGVPGIKASGTC
jgi:hypothetical protein